MTQQLKNDIRTIFELLGFLIVWMCISYIPPFVFIPLFIFSIGMSIYFQYDRRTNKNIIAFPTLNDEYHKMMPVTFGVLILIFSIIGYFAFNIKPYYSLIGVIVAAAVFIFGIFMLPMGFLSVEKHILKLYGIAGNIDTRQLKEIILKNDKITLTNIYDEHKNSINLDLNPIIAGKIKKFIEEKLPQSTIAVIDMVTVPE